MRNFTIDLFFYSSSFASSVTVSTFSRFFFPLSCLLEVAAKKGNFLPHRPTLIFLFRRGCLSRFKGKIVIFLSLPWLQAAPLFERKRRCCRMSSTRIHYQKARFLIRKENSFSPARFRSCSFWFSLLSFFVLCGALHVEEIFFLFFTRCGGGVGDRQRGDGVRLGINEWAIVLIIPPPLPTHSWMNAKKAQAIRLMGVAGWID